VPPARRRPEVSETGGRQDKCVAFEGKHGLLEAKLAALALAEADEQQRQEEAAAKRESRGSPHRRCARGDTLDDGSSDPGDDGTPMLDMNDPEVLERCLQCLDVGDSGVATDRRWKKITAHSLHCLLMSALSCAEGATGLVGKILRVWVARLAAAWCGNPIGCQRAFARDSDRPLDRRRPVRCSHCRHTSGPATG